MIFSESMSSACEQTSKSADAVIGRSPSVAECRSKASSRSESAAVVRLNLAGDT